MKILFYTDPHIGLRRKANSTAESSVRRERHYLRKLLGHCRVFRVVNGKDSLIFCLADFFDRVSNPEEVILSAMKSAQETDLIMAGNHDVPNRAERESSLRVLQEMFPNKILIAGQETGKTFSTVVDNTLFCFVPHALTDVDHQAAISEVCEEAEQHNGHRVLCLHCNWDFPEERRTAETLNLTKERAYELLGFFHYILIGHVHTPADYYEGRVKVIGSVFPTGFDNLENKRTLIYNTSDGTFSEMESWNNERMFSGLASGVSHTGGDALEYYDLEDDLPPGEAQRLVGKLFKGGAYGVRLRRPQGEEQEQAPRFTAGQFSKLSESVGAELKENHPRLYELWVELSKEE